MTRKGSQGATAEHTRPARRRAVAGPGRDAGGRGIPPQPRPHGLLRAVAGGEHRLGARRARSPVQVGVGRERLNAARGARVRRRRRGGYSGPDGAAGRFMTDHLNPKRPTLNPTPEILHRDHHDEGAGGRARTRSPSPSLPTSTASRCAAVRGGLSERACERARARDQGQSDGKAGVSVSGRCTRAPRT